MWYSILAGLCFGYTMQFSYQKPNLIAQYWVLASIYGWWFDYNMWSACWSLCVSLNSQPTHQNTIQHNTDSREGGVCSLWSPHGFEVVCCWMVWRCGFMIGLCFWISVEKASLWDERVQADVWRSRRQKWKQNHPKVLYFVRARTEDGTSRKPSHLCKRDRTWTRHLKKWRLWPASQDSDQQGVSKLWECQWEMVRWFLSNL